MISHTIIMPTLDPDPTLDSDPSLDPHPTLDPPTLDPALQQPLPPPALYPHPRETSLAASPELFHTSTTHSLSNSPLALTPGGILSAIESELELQASDHNDLISVMESPASSLSVLCSSKQQRSACALPSRVRFSFLQMIVWIIVVAMSFDYNPTMQSFFCAYFLCIILSLSDFIFM